MNLLPRTPRSGLRLLALMLCLFSLASLAGRTPGERVAPSPRPLDPGPDLSGPEASRADVERTCGRCHAMPSPDLFPRDRWPHEVERGFRFLARSPSPPSGTPSFASVVSYFRRRAPEELPRLEQTVPTAAAPLDFRAIGHPAASGALPPGIADVRFVRLSDPRRLDVLACDMINGTVSVLRPYEPGARLRVVTDAIAHPAHAEVADLDRDGMPDLLVADLGSETPTDERLGGVFWLRGDPDGSFRPPVALAVGLGRVADVQAADLDADGDLDLVVAEFGYLDTGGIRLLENRTTDAERPSFLPTTVDPRHGTIQTAVADLNADGRPDLVALISQEHETVVAFLNVGNRRFRPEVLYTAPHPAFGSSSIQLVDLDRDGDPDVLMTNGDSLDTQMLRPYHGVQWLENRGEYPFRCHHLASLYGAQRAVAGDLDGDGDLDIVAASFLPGEYYRALCRERGLDALIALEQVAPGRFVRHRIEGVTCDHAACDLGDYDADGRLDLVTGNFFLPIIVGSTDDHREADPLVVRRNLGRSRAERD